MVLIPTDAGLSMRTQAGPTLPHPVAPATEIPADLASFRTGQVFSARIQEVLPENTYKALVAGKNLTLSLPEGAKAGDTLELVVVDRTPRSLVARLVQGGAATPEGADALANFTSLSRTAQLIGSLLGRGGEPPPPAMLNRGLPLMPHMASPSQMPQLAGAIAPSPLQLIQQMAQQLAPQLARAVSQSGLFYEAHQVQWVKGQLPLSSLLAEPQGARSRPASSAGVDAGIKDTEAADPSAPRASTSQARTTAEPGAIPEELKPLVHQQLDALATQRLVWHGESWPGQAIEWSIEPDHGRPDGSTDGEDAQEWRTRLRLTMPRLGEVDVQLHLSSAGVSLHIGTREDGAATDLRTALPLLTGALQTAGIPVRQVWINDEQPQ